MTQELIQRRVVCFDFAVCSVAKDSNGRSGKSVRYCEDSNGIKSRITVKIKSTCRVDGLSVR